MLLKNFSQLARYAAGNVPWSCVNHGSRLLCLILRDIARVNFLFWISPFHPSNSLLFDLVNIDQDITCGFIEGVIYWQHPSAIFIKFYFSFSHNYFFLNSYYSILHQLSSVACRLKLFVFYFFSYDQLAPILGGTSLTVTHMQYASVSIVCIVGISMPPRISASD